MGRTISKKITSLTALMLTMLIMISSFYVPWVHADEVKAKTTDNVNFRTEGSLSGAIIGLVYTGTDIVVLDTSNSEWYKVRVNGQEGYIYSQYIQIESSQGSADSYTSTTTASVNVRTGAGLSYGIIHVASTGTKVTVLDTSNSDWYKVKIPDGRTGYIYSEYLTKAPTTSSTPKPSPSTSPSTTPTTPPSTSSTKGVTTDYVNLRTGAGTNYPTIGTIATGTSITITDTSNSSWYKVTLASGTAGYMYSEYIKIVSSDSDNTDETGLYIAKATDFVNVRAGAGKNYTSITVVSTNTEVTVLDTSNSSWHKVKLASGTVGYMYSQYLAKVKDIEKPTPSPSVSPSATATATPTPTPSPSATATATPTPTPSPSTEPTDEYQAYTTDSVNLREGASTSTQTFGVLATGTHVTVIDDSNPDWTKVKTSDGKVGYIYSIYLKKVSTSSTPSPDADISYVQVNSSDGLYLRASASTGSEILDTLLNKTILILLEKTNDDWYKVSTSDGKTGYVYSLYVKSYSGATGSDSKIISATKATVSQHQTLYLTAEISGSEIWMSSDASIATVNNGFVSAKNPGTVTITVSDSFGLESGSCVVTVTQAEQVRFAYSEINTPVANEQFNLVAITDNTKSEVTFTLPDGENVKSTSYKEESVTTDGFGTNTVRIFTAPVTLAKGTYKIKAHSTDASKAKEFSVIVGDGSNVGSTEARLVSNEIINIIANFEGYIPVVYYDQLAYGIPTLGYGLVVNKNETFYNNLTKTEAKSLLIDTINNGGYTSSLNNYVKNNNVLITQNQFDALVSLSYNIGTGWLSNSDVKNVLSTGIDYTKVDFTNGQAATTVSDMVVFADKSTSSTVVNSLLKKNSSVTVTGYWKAENTKELWYSITSPTFSGTGWVRAGYVKLDSSTSYDLSFVDSQALAYRLLEWHNAGGNCIYGLLMRRLAEAKIFLYDNYEEAYNSNANYTKNTYGFVYPSCMKQYE